MFAGVANRNQENTDLCVPVYYITKDMVNDTDEQPDKEIHRARSGRVPSAGALSLWSWVHHPPGCVHQPRSSLNPILLGFFMEASSHRHD